MPISFGQIQNLRLADVTFGEGALTSLFQALSANPPPPFRLDLSRARADDMDDFVAMLPTFEIPTLAGLHWDGNIIQEGHQNAFLTFIGRHPGLRELWLADALSSTSLPLIQGVAALHGLTHLSIAVIDTVPPQLQLRPSLMRLIQNNDIQFLDVSGQPLQEATLFAVLDAAPNLRDFRFDKTDLSCGEAFNAVCRRVLAKESLRFSVFPSNELIPALTRSPILSRMRIQKETNALSRQFEDRSWKVKSLETSPGLSAFLEFMRHASEILPAEDVRQSPVTHGPTEINPPISDNFSGMSDFVEYPPEVMELLALCGEVTGVDPLIKAFAEIEAAIDTRVLLEQLSAVQ
jgi:hypothetical protein